MTLKLILDFLFTDLSLTKTHIYLWHPLIFIHCLQIYLWMKRLIFELIWFSIKRRKLKACLSDILNNYLHFLLSHLVFFLMMFIINRLMVQRWVLHWDQHLFLVYYEHKWLKKCPLQFRPKYYRRYVHDFFSCLKEEIL